MPVGRRDDRLARTERIRKRPGNDLRLMPVRRDVDVRGADIFNHLFRADKTVLEDHLRFNSHFLRQSLQGFPVTLPFATQNMRMRRPGHNVGGIRVFRENLRHRPNHVLDPLIR